MTTPVQDSKTEARLESHPRSHRPAGILIAAPALGAAIWGIVFLGIASLL